MPFTNPGSEEIKALLHSVNNIAVVGFSPKPGRASHNIARQMQRFGFQIIPVRLGIMNIWMQEGAEHEASAERARAAGMTVVMGRCIMRDYTRLCLE